MTNRTLYEVTEVAVTKHPRKGVLLLHSERRAWHFPDCTLTVGEAWDDSLLQKIKEMTGLTDNRIESVLAVQNFDPGEVAERPQYGVFILCRTDSTDVSLGGEVDDFLWVDAVSELNDLPLFHPRVKEFVDAALQTS